MPDINDMEKGAWNVLNRSGHLPDKLALVSIAISMKRIADSLAGFECAVSDMQDVDLEAEVDAAMNLALASSD